MARRALIVANGKNPAIRTSGEDLAAALAERGVEGIAWHVPESEQPVDPRVCGTPLARRSGFEGVEIVLVLGGDGFMMSTIRALQYPATPFYGINYGRVGFLMNPRLEARHIAEILTCNGRVSATYPTLAAEVIDREGRSIQEYAFNDVVIERASGQTVQLDTYIEDVLLNRYSGDGLVVATPGGSTAYSLAAGGPAVHHSVDCMIVTPLCPHRPVQFHSMQFSVVLSLESRVRIVCLEHTKRPVRCVCDGRAIEGVSEVAIGHRGLRIELMRGPGYNFVDTLVHKVIGGKTEATLGQGRGIED